MSDQPTFDFVKRGAAASPIESTPATFALLVGIDRYADTTLREQRGCVNDVRQLQSFLMSTANVPAENVHVLTDEQATRAAIRTAWDRLEKAAAPGDQVWFHFSGHGSQLPSEDPDEVDGLDETLVPHDGRLEGENQILDKEVEAWVQRLAEKGCYPVVTADTHHTGGWLNPNTVPENALLLAACRENENCFETQDAESGAYGGVFTLALLRALRGYNEEMTWRDLFDAVWVAVHATGHQQTPQMIGNGNRRLGGGKTGPLPPYLLVMEMREPGQGAKVAQESIQSHGNDGREIRVNGGASTGLTAGATLHVYPPRHDLQGEPAAIAEVTEVHAGHAWAWVQSLPAAVGPGSRAYLAGPGHGQERLTVDIDRSAGALGSLSSAFAEINPYAGAGVVRVLRENGSFVVADGSSGQHIFDLPASEQAEADVMAALDHVARYRLALQVVSGPNGDTEVSDALEMTATPSPAVDFRLTGAALAEGETILSGEQIRISLHNRSEWDLHGVLLYFSPELGVHRLLPRHTDCQFLPAGGTIHAGIAVDLLSTVTEGAGVFRALACTHPAAFVLVQPDLHWLVEEA